MTRTMWLVVGGLVAVILVCLCVGGVVGGLVVSGTLISSSQKQMVGSNDPVALVATPTLAEPGKATPVMQPGGPTTTAKTTKSTPTVAATGPSTVAKTGPVGTFYLPHNLAGDAVVTRSPSTAVDDKGGIHVAYATWGDNSGRNATYYAYCAANCGSAANFALVRIGGSADYVNLALDPAGHPRIMLIGLDPAKEKLNAYQYAACDGNCTKGENWTLTRLVATDEGIAHNSRFFGLDPQGRPRFVYVDKSYNHRGSFLAYCDANCTSPSATGWTETPLSEDEFTRVSLSFSSGGLPRMAFYLAVAPDWKQYVVYVECSTPNCSQWDGSMLYRISAAELLDDPGAYFALRLDKNDRPRLALYPGNVDQGSALQANELYYLWCNDSCTADNAWTGYSPGFPEGAGTWVDLLLDQTGRPQLAYGGGADGLRYAWCTANCEATNASWQNLLVEASAAMDRIEPVPVEPRCSASGWFAGLRPSLALDPSGNPRIAYDVEHGQAGSCKAHVDVKWSRIALFNKP